MFCAVFRCCLADFRWQMAQEDEAATHVQALMRGRLGRNRSQTHVESAAAEKDAKRRAAAKKKRHEQEAAAHKRE